MRRSFVAGNWKMNGNTHSTQQLLQNLVDDLAIVGNVELAVFPPFPFLAQCDNTLKNTAIKWGAQNVSEFSDGAYTGEVSAAMLKNLGCHYVIIGHSERRQLLGEENQAILQKCEMACYSAITPILCVGETAAQHDAGLALSIVQEQLAVVAALKDNCAAFTEIVIAYEPVWAIGTGKSATPELAQTVHAAIRAELSKIDTTFANATRILYGGSVKQDNAKALFAMPDIDGALVGGASLNAKSFLEIGRLCNNSF